MVQIRNVPEELHRKLKARAAMAGMTISDYLLRDLERSLERPSLEEFLQRLKTRERIDLGESAAIAVRAEREGR